jgi:hypothetical protein
MLTTCGNKIHKSSCRFTKWETQMVPNLENIIMMKWSNINGIGTCDNNAYNTKLQVIDNGDYIGE